MYFLGPLSAIRNMQYHKCSIKMVVVINLIQCIKKPVHSLSPLLQFRPERLEAVIKEKGYNFFAQG